MGDGLVHVCCLKNVNKGEHIRRMSQEINCCHIHVGKGRRRHRREDGQHLERILLLAVCN
jgi:hypothetical protein